MPTLKERIDAMDAQAREMLSPEQIEQVMAAVVEVLSGDIAKDAIRTGATAPNFSLKTHTGERVNSADLLQDEMLIINFIKGSWCLYCVAELQAIQASMGLINQKSVNIVTISSQLPKHYDALIEQTGTECKIVFDEEMQTADAFGLGYDVPESLTTAYKEVMGLDMAEHHANAGKRMSIPAVYVIDSDNKIVYDYINPNWLEREEPEVYMNREF